MGFRDREDAAHRLAEKLRDCKGEDPLILAIPRGALPMGAILAEALDGELDVALVHKLGVPLNPEYAIGAVAETGEVVMSDAADVAAVPRAYVERETERQLEVLRARRARYTPGRPAADPRGRLVIVVDDGIATGSTFKAALRTVRAQGPRGLIAAVAVAPQESLAAIEPLADRVVCLETPPRFFAVGGFFDDFRQIGDDEVVEILHAAARRRAAKKTRQVKERPAEPAGLAPPAEPAAEAQPAAVDAEEPAAMTVPAAETAAR
jgi:predicted phosphoribosyltransferase